MEIVEVNCPRSIDLLSIKSIKEKYLDAKSILETIDIYDFISIKQEIKKETGIMIISNDNLSITFQEQLKEILNIFSKYVGLKIHNLTIEIKLNPFVYLKTEENILAGLLLALNNYFKKYLTLHELVYLANKINPLISYYIVGGYKKIDMDNKNINIGENIYHKYFLLDKMSNNNEEIERLQTFLTNYNNIDYGIDECYFVAIKDFVLPRIPISLKKEFPNVVVNTFSNVKEPKVLIKYLK